MSEMIDCYYGRLKAITYKPQKNTKDWRDDLIGSCGLIYVFDDGDHKQRIVYELTGCARMSTTGGTVEISDGKFTIDTSSSTFEFAIETSDMSYFDLARAAGVRREIRRIELMFRRYRDPERAKRLLQLLEEFRQAISREFVPC